MSEVQAEVLNYHRLIGEVITKNAALESWLEAVLWRSFEGRVSEPIPLATSLLGTQSWTSGKIKLCNAALINLLDKDFRKRWDAIYAELRSLNTFRGDIAHSELIVIHDADENSLKTALRKGGSNLLQKNWEIKTDQLEAELQRYHSVFRLLFQFCKDLGDANAQRTA
ncbi:hypothetical protein [Methylobacterium adhaesivum]|uniref:RiboL-PSP-HEPN domain-containing protein n=1 Tax=Methylobacterium adhaesivum TaxID=333297 RepID=A0ABT8BLA0_9HYPH|nr:hypothetical protein [Methylobacterium adhaesivum]MDN3592101.1 hypothetical protein [Methylobacterium adhaesivum]